MPLPPPPVTYHCPACGWSRTVAPRSDVLMPGVDHFRACPACGHQPLQAKPAGMAAVAAAQLARWLRR